MIKLLLNLLSFSVINPPEPKVCNILSLSGGGSLGITEISILEDIYNDEKYDLITGISAGALNALYLSYYKDDFKKGINNMKNIWFNITNDDVYNYEISSIFYNWSLYNTKPLSNTIENIINKLNSTQIKTLIGATNINNSSLDIFDIHSFNNDMKKRILLSSSAIPLLFPPQKINNTLYVDGGLITNQIVYNIKEYIKCDYYNITLLDTSNPYKINNITYFSDYITSLISILISGFDTKFMKFNNCKEKYGEINIYYVDKQNNITILNFNKPKELYEYGKNYSTIKLDYC